MLLVIALDVFYFLNTRDWSFGSYHEEQISLPGEKYTKTMDFSLSQEDYISQVSVLHLATFQCQQNKKR